jgi:microcystin-dependent protein
MNRFLFAASSLALSWIWSATAQAADPYVGEIIATGHNFCPSGWMPLNGQLLAIAENDVLFQLIGTTYGGDGEETFALPVAKPVFTASGATLTYCISLFGVFPSQN